jgi:hypothetical protein
MSQHEHQPIFRYWCVGNTHLVSDNPHYRPHVHTRGCYKIWTCAVCHEPLYDLNWGTS